MNRSKTCSWLSPAHKYQLLITKAHCGRASITTGEPTLCSVRSFLLSSALSSVRRCAVHRGTMQRDILHGPIHPKEADSFDVLPPITLLNYSTDCPLEERLIPSNPCALVLVARGENPDGADRAPASNVVSNDIWNTLRSVNVTKLCRRLRNSSNGLSCHSTTRPSPPVCTRRFRVRLPMVDISAQTRTTTDHVFIEHNKHILDVAAHNPSQNQWHGLSCRLLPPLLTARHVALTLPSPMNALSCGGVRGGFTRRGIRR